MAYLLCDGIDSEAIAHMKAEAALRPPPQSRKIDDSHISFRGKMCGNRPRNQSIQLGD
jgi:hypothetical protein